MHFVSTPLSLEIAQRFERRAFLLWHTAAPGVHQLHVRLPSSAGKTFNESERVSVILRHKDSHPGEFLRHVRSLARRGMRSGYESHSLSASH